MTATKTGKGSYQITESFLREIPTPKPTSRKTVKSILALVDDAEAAITSERIAHTEKQLSETVSELLREKS